MAAVQQDGHALQFAWEDMMNKEHIVMAAVQQDGHAFQYASEEMKNTESIVMAAVQQDGHALQLCTPVRLRGHEEHEEHRDGCSAAVWLCTRVRLRGHEEHPDGCRTRDFFRILAGFAFPGSRQRLTSFEHGARLTQLRRQAFYRILLEDSSMHSRLWLRRRFSRTVCVDASLAFSFWQQWQWWIHGFNAWFCVLLAASNAVGL